MLTPNPPPVIVPPAWLTTEPRVHRDTAVVAELIEPELVTTLLVKSAIPKPEPIPAIDPALVTVAWSPYWDTPADKPLITPVAWLTSEPSWPRLTPALSKNAPGPPGAVMEPELVTAPLRPRLMPK